LTDGRPAIDNNWLENRIRPWLWAEPHGIAALIAPAVERRVMT